MITTRFRAHGFGRGVRVWGLRLRVYGLGATDA